MVGVCASCQNQKIRKLQVAPGMPGTFFFRHRLQKKPLIRRHARTVMHIGIANPLWRGNVPGILGAWATRNFTYLAGVPCPRVYSDKNSNIILYWEARKRTNLPTKARFVLHRGKQPWLYKIKHVAFGLSNTNQNRNPICYLALFLS